MDALRPWSPSKSNPLMWEWDGVWSTYFGNELCTYLVIRLTDAVWLPVPAGCHRVTDSYHNSMEDWLFRSWRGADPSHCVRPVRTLTPRGLRPEARGFLSNPAFRIYFLLICVIHLEIPIPPLDIYLPVPRYLGLFATYIFPRRRRRHC